MARHAWENDYFQNHTQRPSIDEFVEALNDDFHKIRPVLMLGDRLVMREITCCGAIDRFVAVLATRPASSSDQIVSPVELEHKVN